VQITWENTSVKFGVAVDNDTKILSGLDCNRNVRSALIISTTRKMLKTASKWTDEYFANGKHADEFWNMNYKAQIQLAAGEKESSTRDRK